jgi:hypothetical protein
MPAHKEYGLSEEANGLDGMLLDRKTLPGG